MEKLTIQKQQELKLFLQENKRTAEEVKRAQGILLLDNDSPKELIETLTGLQRDTLVKVRKKYIKIGIEAVASKRKEKKVASLLTKQQREDIKEMLHTKSPRDYGWECDHWTSGILGKLILELYGVKYKSKTSLYLIFKQSKYTYHKPKVQYARRNQEVIDQWTENHKEKVKEFLQDDDVVLLVADEMTITSQTTTQKIWLPEGETPIIQHSNVRKRQHFYGFLNIKTGKQIAFKTDRETSEISAAVLAKVLKQYAGKKVVLFWDNAPWHKGEEMRKFLKTCENFLIINFPPYAPDENPQEHVWKALRANVTHNTFIKDINKTAQDMLIYLNNTLFKYKFFGFTAS
jgi:transposase